MRRIKYSLMILVVLLMCSSANALNVYLIIDSVTTYVVHGTVRLYNPNSTQQTLIFPSSGTFEMMVDGQVETVGYLDILTTLVVPAMGILEIPVSYHSPTEFSNDVHTAQARYVLPGNPPAGNPVTFVYGPALSGVYDVNYTLVIDSIGATNVQGTLVIENPYGSYWSLNFPYGLEAWLLVDNVHPSMLLGPMSTTLTIAANSTIELDVSHYQNTAYPPGEHIIQAQLLSNGRPLVGAPISFTVQPVGNDDAISIPSEFVAYPNPFCISCCITPKDKGSFALEIYNLKGQKVLNTAAWDSFLWDGKDGAGRICPEGVYLIKTTQGTKSVVKRVLKY